MPDVNRTKSCPPDCLCQKHTALEVVPYRENDADDADGASCPSDELLLHTWRANGCIQCLTWWVERVWRDPRYIAIVRHVQRRWRKVNVEDLLQAITSEVYKGKNQGWRSVAACFRQALRRAAYDEHKRLVRSQGTEIDFEADIIAPDENESSNPRLRLLEECLERLSEEEIRLKEAAYDQDRTHTVIAKMLGETQGTVSQRLSRLRKKLGDCIRSKE